MAASPAAHVHVGSALLERTRPRDLWLLLDGAAVIGALYRGRGLAMAVDERRVDELPLIDAVAGAIRRLASAQDVVYGPERLLRRAIEPSRLRGVSPLEIRRQALMSAWGPPSPAATGARASRAFVLRPSSRSDLSWLLEAHGAMCREDLGVDQVSRNSDGYARYFAELIAAGRSFIGTVDGRPVFKAETPVESLQARLIEGVYTIPTARRQGYASAAMAEIGRSAGRDAKQACLYVHRRNAAALRLYRRLGYREICSWLTMLTSRQTVARWPPAEY
ncbi:MAG: GNAT family N-acetyltransferase [Acidobacteriota bacterium]|nr:MAG: GNAT family N-acetyltransferase [Acidobacteriota bacterium]